MEAYLDNSATTRCSERAIAVMVRLLSEDYGNPSSLHGMGANAEAYIKEAKSKDIKGSRKGNHLHFRRNRVQQPGCFWKC